MSPEVRSEFLSRQFKIGESSLDGSGSVPVSWLMLTSSCLSRGAQGYMVENRDLASDGMHYANFELGVVFVSKLTGGEDDVLYVTKGRNGGDDGMGENEEVVRSGVRIISLPVPYDIERSKKYVVEDGDLDENDYEGGVFRYIPHMNTHEGLRTYSKCTSTLPLPPENPNGTVLVASRGRFNHAETIDNINKKVGVASKSVPR